jgi:hypothetical protein
MAPRVSIETMRAQDWFEEGDKEALGRLVKFMRELKKRVPSGFVNAIGAALVDGAADFVEDTIMPELD